jgi:hypothetical protein
MNDYERFLDRFCEYFDMKPSDAKSWIDLIHMESQSELVDVSVDPPSFLVDALDDGDPRKDINFKPTHPAWGRE